jgi:hypothetical protein
MINRPARWIVLLLSGLLIPLVLISCTMPQIGTQSPTPPGEDPQAIFTAVMETVIADMTRTAAVHTATPSLQPVDPTEAPHTPTPLPTDTPAPSPTATEVIPTATPTLTAPPTADPSDPRTGLGQPTFRDPFDNENNWSFDTNINTSMRVENGKLVMEAFNANFFNGWAFTRPSAQDMYLEIIGEHKTCAGLDRFGMIFRSPVFNEGYLLGFSCDGRYSLWIWDSEKEIRLVEWTASPHILTGEGVQNRFGVKAEGNKISIYANGQLLNEVEDNTYEQGRFGVFVGSARTPGYQTEVDELAYWNLDS